MSRKRMIMNAVLYGISGFGCYIAGGVMFRHADRFISALKKEGEN